MAIKEIDGFMFLDGLDEKYIAIESNRSNEYIEYIVKNKIKAVYLCNLYFRDKDIDFLKKCEFIEKLNITSTTIEDYQGLHYLRDLRVLSLGGPKAVVDLGYNLSLSELSVDMNKNIVGIDKLKKLRILKLWNYKPKSKDLSEIRMLNSIEELKITDSSIESLNGCGELEKIEKLELNYLKKLYYIDELEKNKNSIKVLEFNSCKNIKNHDYVECLSNLEKLSYNKCGNIETIGFINKMPNLKQFIFMDTNVVDGNLEACTRLEYVAFVNKKHYSHKNRDFKQTLKS